MKASTAAQPMGLKDFTVLLVLSERLKLTLRTIFHVGCGIINQGSQFYRELWQLFIPVNLRDDKAKLFQVGI